MPLIRETFGFEQCYIYKRTRCYTVDETLAKTWIGRKARRLVLRITFEINYFVDRLNMCISFRVIVIGS